MKLSECPSRSNNLQLLRFVAAIFVIFSHSFSLSTGDSSKEWLTVLTNGQLTSGGLAVSVFFCAGGYLIAKSIMRVNDGFAYFRARVFKIFPALIVIVFVTTFILGPMVTEESIGDYFANKQTYGYLLNALMILKHDLPGVFINNPSVPTVNGSLWTLPVEFLCYIGCYFMWKTKLLHEKMFKWSVPIVVVGTIGLRAMIQYIQVDILLSAIRPGLLFYMGILYYVYRDKIMFTKTGVFINALILILCSVYGVLDFGLVICFPYLLFYICFVIPQVSEKMGKMGNISYGMYLCGFPIQQTLVLLFEGHMSSYVNMILSTLLAILFGILVYYFVEAPIIHLERRIAK